MKIQQIAIQSLRLITFTALMSLVQFQAAQAQAPQGKPATVRGKISAVEKQALKVTTSAGEVLVKLPDDVRIGGVEAAKLSDITAEIMSARPRSSKPMAISRPSKSISSPRALAAQVKATGRGICSPAQR
jgi:hypothetical protein